MSSPKLEATENQEVSVESQGESPGSRDIAFLDNSDGCIALAQCEYKRKRINMKKSPRTAITSDIFLKSSIPSEGKSDATTSPKKTLSSSDLDQKDFIEIESSSQSSPTLGSPNHLQQPSRNDSYSVRRLSTAFQPSYLHECFEMASFGDLGFETTESNTDQISTSSDEKAEVAAKTEQTSQIFKPNPNRLSVSALAYMFSNPPEELLHSPSSLSSRQAKERYPAIPTLNSSESLENLKSMWNQSPRESKEHINKQEDDSKAPEPYKPATPRLSRQNSLASKEFTAHLEHTIKEIPIARARILSEHTPNPPNSPPTTSHSQNEVRIGSNRKSVFGVMIPDSPSTSAKADQEDLTLLQDQIGIQTSSSLKRSSPSRSTSRSKLESMFGIRSDSSAPGSPSSQKKQKPSKMTPESKSKSNRSLKDSVTMQRPGSSPVLPTYQSRISPRNIGLPPEFAESEYLSEDVVPDELAEYKYPTISMDGTMVRTGTVLMLIRQLTRKTLQSVDMNKYRIYFFMSYRNFIQPTQLFMELSREYSNPPNVPLNNSALLLTIRDNTIEALLTWIRLVPDDFFYDNVLFGVCKTFADNLIDIINSEQANKVNNCLIEAKDEYLKVFRNVQVKDCPSPIAALDILDLSSKEIAQELTMMTADALRTLSAFDFWEWATAKRAEKTNPTKPSLRRVFFIIARFNLISLWVSTEILKRIQIGPRVKMLKKFISVALELFDVQNFDTCIAVISALDSAPVHRLKSTWKQLDSKIISKYNTLVGLLSPDDNSKSYRQHISSLDPPAIPQSGIILKDLTFLQEGQASWIEGLPVELKVINFSKWANLASTVFEIKRLRPDKYNFRRNLKLKNYIEAYHPYDEKQAFEVSQHLESRPMSTRPTSPRPED